jgi:hypothetical protein
MHPDITRTLDILSRLVTHDDGSGRHAKTADYPSEQGLVWCATAVFARNDDARRALVQS